MRRRDHLAGRQARRHRHPASVLLARSRLSRRRQLPRLHGRDRGRARAGRKLHPQAGRGHEGQCLEPPRGNRAQDDLRPSGLRSARRASLARSRFEILDLGRQDGGRDRPLPRAREDARADRSHLAMAVNLDACIQCNLCVRACREVQVNDVIGMAGRGYHEKIVFDFDDPMGNSTCVACGECVQACPTGALMPSSLVNAGQCPHRICRQAGRFGLPLLRRRLPAHLQHQGRQAALMSPARTARRTRTGCASRAASASTTSTIRSASPSR